PRLHARDAADGALGRFRVPRAADDRRACPPSAREARARSARARVHLHGPRRRLPLHGLMSLLRTVGARLSLALLAVVAIVLGLRSPFTRAPAHGTVTRGGQRYAEVAVPVPGSNLTMLFATPLHDALEDVDLVENRLLVAGGIALVVALLIGYGAARVFARRI